MAFRVTPQVAGCLWGLGFGFGFCGCFVGLLVVFFTATWIVTLSSLPQNDLCNLCTHGVSTRAKKIRAQQAMAHPTGPLTSPPNVDRSMGRHPKQCVNAFYSIPRLRHILVESGLHTVGASAWQNCHQLQIVKLLFFARVESPFMQKLHRSACAIFSR